MWGLPWFFLKQTDFCKRLGDSTLIDNAVINVLVYTFTTFCLALHATPLTGRRLNTEFDSVVQLKFLKGLFEGEASVVRARAAAKEELLEAAREVFECTVVTEFSSIGCVSLYT